MDEIWLYHYKLETKQQRMEWRHSGSPRPKNSGCKNPLENFSPRLFWDQDGILENDYLPMYQTINAEYYSSLLVELKEKRLGKVSNVVLFLHNNAPAHRALATQKKLAYLGFQCLDNASYSPDLAPSDYLLFPGLKKQLKGVHCCRLDLIGRKTF
jgi:histone-lysine N-methyltransferase SETMAR